MNDLPNTTISDNYPPDSSSDDVWVIGDKYHEKAILEPFKEGDLNGNKTAEITPHDAGDDDAGETIAGGAWYVKNFVEKAIKTRRIAPGIRTYEYEEPSKVFAATHTLRKERAYPDSSVRKYRIKITKDYALKKQKFTPVSEGNYPRRLLVIEDMNLGYRIRGKREWKELLSRFQQNATTPSKLDPNIIVLLGGDVPDVTEWTRTEKDKNYSIWSALYNNHYKQTIVVMNADLLRFMGANISRRLSWERTVQDLINELESRPRFKPLGKFAHLVIRFGVTAAVHCFKVGGDTHRILHYDTKAHDGIFRDVPTEGGIVGNNSVFTAWIAAELLAKRENMRPIARIGLAIKSAIPACQKLFRLGYPEAAQNRGNAWLANWPDDDIFTEQTAYTKQENIKPLLDKWVPTVPELVRHTEVPPGIDDWNILKQSAVSASIFGLARQIVFFGIKDSLNLVDAAWRERITGGSNELVSEAQAKGAPEAESLNIENTEETDKSENSKTEFLQVHAPIARFGQVNVVDREEIESFRGVYNLIKQYLTSKTDTRPLSIAVFGPPGSGKTFLVEEIIKEVRPDFKTPQVKLNMTQMLSLEHVTDAVISQIKSLDRVFPPPPVIEQAVAATTSTTGDVPPTANDDIISWNKALKTHDVPILFFDEFDCNFHGPLGWLKSMLAPMEDGILGPNKNLQSISLKRSILIFAGGIKSAFGEFSCENLPQDDEIKAKFSDTKGPDFVSRLRGYIDIKGINRTGPSDSNYLLRRAIMLRSILSDNLVKQKERSPGVILDEAQIDSGVLYAMLKIGVYKHGARSMRALVSMCIPLLERLEKAALPAPKLLDMHVDSNEFRSLIEEYQHGDNDPFPKAETHNMT